MRDLYVYSALANNQFYNFYDYKVPEGTPPKSIREKGVLVLGGANVNNKHLVTPKGVATRITPEEYEVLKQNYVFNLHVKNGHVLVDQSPVAQNADDVAVNLEKDASAQKTPEDFKELANNSNAAEPEGTGNKFKRR